MTMLCDRFLADVLPKKRANTQRDYGNVIQHVIKPEMGRKKVAAVNSSDIEKLHREITDRGAPTRANRVVAVVAGCDVRHQAEVADGQPVQRGC